MSSDGEAAPCAHHKTGVDSARPTPLRDPLLQNMLDVTPHVCEMLLERTQLLPWVFGRLRPKAFDANKQLAGEIMALLLQHR